MRSLANSICEILCSAGMDADSVTNSAEVATRTAREKFHAVFLDMRMSHPDGIALARQVRASAVNASTVIVMITGEEDRTFMARAFEAGVEFFLFKPIERNTQAPSGLLTHQGLRFGNLGHSKTTKVELLVWPVIVFEDAFCV